MKHRYSDALHLTQGPRQGSYLRIRPVETRNRLKALLASRAHYTNLPRKLYSSTSLHATEIWPPTYASLQHNGALARQSTTQPSIDKHRLRGLIYLDPS
jgi:hypothetical protein